MTEDKGKIPFGYILIGFAAGALLVYWFLKNRNPNMALSPPSTLDSNSIGIGLNALQNRMNLIEQKLDMLPMQSIQPIQMQSPIQIPSINHAISQIAQTATAMASPTSIPTLATYNNKEITEYIKDKDGDIIKKIVTRDANINDKR